MRMGNRAGVVTAAVVCVLLLFVPQIAPHIHLAISICTEVLLFAMAAMAVNLLVGYTGVLPFGNAAFFGLGAYGAGLTIEYWHVGFFSSIGLGILASLIGALLIGPFLLRRRGIYFALLMIAFGQVFYFIAYRFTDITGGEDGMNFARPAVEWLGWQLKDENFYYAMLAFFFIVGILFLLLVRSPFGRSLVAIKENETRARYLGLNTDRFIFVALLISAAIEGLAGACYGLSIMFAYPLMLDWHNSGNIVLMTILGGSGTVFGPFLGALIFVIGNDILSSAVPWWQIPLGALFVACVLGFPKGILGTVLDFFEKRRGGFGYEARDTLHSTVLSEREIQQ
ncbi:MAG TPA: branched-chain amino acid ABC transporter permease [Candidatus Acidoferrales bacterium]|nr:branched-chain amino acid ABC transporter permease [Candidatus Acidoferrales bacterium]